MLNLKFLSNFQGNSLPREKSDTLLLLAACFLTLIPFGFSLEFWVTAAWLVLFGWRAWICVKGHRLPSRYLLMGITILLCGFAFVRQGSWMNREVGITLLVILLTAKLLEMHARRDWLIVIFLNFFLLLTQFFYFQSFLGMLWVLFTLSIVLTAQLSLQYITTQAPFVKRWKLVVRNMMFSLPLCIMAFYLFPRIQGPLWGSLSDQNQARSGLSSSMSPGNIAQLALSDELSFRVKFQKEIPHPSQLYWRGYVLNKFDGRTWSLGSDASVIPKPWAEYKGPAINQEVILESNAQGVMFALDLPASMPQLLNGKASSINQRMELRANQDSVDRVQYQVRSYPEYRYGASLKPSDLRNSIELPPRFNPRARQFALDLLYQTQDSRAFIQALLKHFNQENFVYTLEPPQLGDHSVDEFLFNTKAGFCEHYASAFVFLARAAGIPARIITGYQGGQRNIFDGYIEVRQSEAHAWAEVWLPQQGWVRVDPTAAVAPQRVMQSYSRSTSRGGVVGLLDLNAENLNLLRLLEMRIDAFNNAWNRWVLNFNANTQKTLLDDLNFSGLEWQQFALLMLIAGTTVILLIFVPLMRPKEKRDPAYQLYLDFCAYLARKEYPKKDDEAPLTYLTRLKIQLTPQAFASAEVFVRTWVRYTYEPPARANPSVVGDLKKAFADLKRTL